MYYQFYESDNQFYEEGKKSNFSMKPIFGAFE